MSLLVILCYALRSAVLFLLPSFISGLLYIFCFLCSHFSVPFNSLVNVLCAVILIASVKAETHTTLRGCYSVQVIRIRRDNCPDRRYLLCQMLDCFPPAARAQCCFTSSSPSLLLLTPPVVFIEAIPVSKSTAALCVRSHHYTILLGRIRDFVDVASGGLWLRLYLHYRAVNHFLIFL